MKRTCRKCGLDSDDLKLFVANKQCLYGREPRCKECQRKELNRYFRARRRNDAEVIDKLKDYPCADCGNQYPAPVMEFDHVRGKKLFSISTAVMTSRPMKKILAEIKKCDLVCANCHRLRTMKRGYS
jgi:hypothetical protein